MGETLALTPRTARVLTWSLLVMAWGNQIASTIGPIFRGRGLEFGGGIANSLMYLLFVAAIFQVLPDTKIAWRAVLPGAAATAVMFTIGKYLLALYLTHASTASAYGAAGSLAAVLIWVYYSAQIMFFGAELTQAYARSRAPDPADVPRRRRSGAVIDAARE